MTLMPKFLFHRILLTNCNLGEILYCIHYGSQDEMEDLKESFI